MKPLAGIKVVEVYEPDCPPALRLAGALAGRVLADLGAEVTVLVSRSGSSERLFNIESEGSALFSFLHAGKLVAALQDGSSDFAARLATADGVLIDENNYRTAKLALPTSCVVLSLFGRDAPSEPGSEFTLLGMSGILDLIGDPDRQPLKLGGHQASYSAGLTASAALLSSLCLKSARETAEPIWVGVLDTLLWLNWKSAVGTQLPGGDVTRLGRDAEWQVLRCADGFVALVFQDADWPALRAYIGDPRLDDPRFANFVGRRQHVRDLVDLIEAVLLTKSRTQLRDEMLACRLPLGPVWTPAELLGDRQYTERHVFTSTSVPGGEMAPLVSLPVTWDGARLPGGAIPAILEDWNA